MCLESSNGVKITLTTAKQDKTSLHYKKTPMRYKIS